MNSELRNKLFKIKRQFKKVFANTDFKIKGHELIQKHEKDIVKILSSSNAVVEVGSERKAGSTLYLARLAKKHKSQFYTVDIDPDTSKAADKIVNKLNPDFAAINKPGELFLQETKEELSLVYLDAFDIPGDWLNDAVYKAYQDRGQQLTIENCWKMHYDCAVSIVKKMKKGGYICFDDVNPIDSERNLILKRVEKKYPKWSGKGETAIPYLLENGFELVDNKRSGALFKKMK